MVRFLPSPALLFVFINVSSIIQVEEKESLLWKFQKNQQLVEGFSLILLMEDIPNNHLGCINPCKQWDIYHINWCRISSINSITGNFNSISPAFHFKHCEKTSLLKKISKPHVGFFSVACICRGIEAFKKFACHMLKETKCPPKPTWHQK